MSSAYDCSASISPGPNTWLGVQLLYRINCGALSTEKCGRWPVHGCERSFQTETSKTNVNYSKLKTRILSDDESSFWATVCKTVFPMLSVRCLSCLSVCHVRALRPNGWTDQDETWHAWYAGRPRPWPHCVRWGPPKGATPQFSAHICCDQMADVRTELL